MSSGSAIMLCRSASSLSAASLRSSADSTTASATVTSACSSVSTDSPASFLDRFDRCHYYFVGRTIVLGHGCRLGCWCNVAGRRRRQRFVYRAEVFEGYIPLYCVHTPLGPSVDDRCKAHEFLLNILQCHCRMYKFTPKIVNYLLIFKDTGANIGRRRRCGIWA